MAPVLNTKAGIRNVRLLNRDNSTVVDNSPHHSKVGGSSLTLVRTGEETRVRKS
jgi:hypothetical protein